MVAFMDIFKNRITEVNHHIIQNDLSLDEISFYEEIINYSDLIYDDSIDIQIKKNKL